MVCKNQRSGELQQSDFAQQLPERLAVAWKYDKVRLGKTCEDAENLRRIENKHLIISSV